MANFTAADVKKLREETDAPMMECKAALDEADGDLARAKEILREKGKAQAGKKAGRVTGAGVVAFAISADKKSVGAVVLESETDFVSNNEGFVAIAQRAADYALANGIDNAEELNGFAVEAVALFRENVVIAQAQKVISETEIALYLHHDKAKGTLVLSEGSGAGTEPVRKVGIQIVAFPPEVINREDLSQEKVDNEIRVEFELELQAGRAETLAKSIATGRVHKEYIRRAVLLEQPFYADGSKSVKQFLSEQAKDTKITGFKYFAVGQVKAE